LKKLTPKDIESHLLSLEGWKESDNILSITYKLSSFMEVMSFANLVSDRSEKIDHHPKIIIDYDTIVFELTTHSVEGLTLLDIRLANFIHETFNEIFTT
jgi:4a-hydroxytetrahydrobiopterin dehydratase|tara:strand:- start:212 stop:508 length:297 start_codon:yes stop_codon:yes gene_type:complete